MRFRLIDLENPMVRDELWPEYKTKTEEDYAWEEDCRGDE